MNIFEAEHPGKVCPLLATVLFLLIAPAVLYAQNQTNYFLIANPSKDPAHNDSYVAPISAPELTAHARELIRQGTSAGRTIIFAEIEAGADGINRDYRAPEAPAWSWHVTRVTSFGDLGAEVLDGWPGLVERNLEEWIDDTQGRIGFWDYTVVAELPLSQPRFGPVNFGENSVQLSFMDLNPPFFYRLEQTSSLSSQSWITVIRFQAINVTMSWSEKVTSTPVFYRLLVDGAESESAARKVANR